MNQSKPLDNRPDPQGTPTNLPHKIVGAYGDLNR